MKKTRKKNPKKRRKINMTKKTKPTGQTRMKTNKKLLYYIHLIYNKYAS